MANETHKPEEIVARLRRVDVLVRVSHARGGRAVLVSTGKSVANAVRPIGVIEATYHADRDDPCRNLPQHGI